MKIGLFQYAIVGLFVSASACSFGNWPKFFFYLFSALINITVLFM
jgi:hypothetical protein